MHASSSLPSEVIEMFEQYRTLASANMTALSLLPARCRGENLIALCEEALSNPDRYPRDKLNRWKGFVDGVLSSQGLQGMAEQLSVGGDVVEPSAAERQALIILFDRYRVVAGKVTVEAERWSERCRKAHLIHLCDSVISSPVAMSADALWQRMGFVQGALAARGLIDVDTERDFTRPLLHALHEHAIPTFG